MGRNKPAEDSFLPRCCTKQSQLHQATLNYERKGHLWLIILIFFTGKVNRFFHLRGWLGALFFFLDTSVWNGEFFPRIHFEFICICIFPRKMKISQITSSLQSQSHSTWGVLQVQSICTITTHAHSHTHLSQQHPERVFLLYIMKKWVINNK